MNKYSSKLVIAAGFSAMLFLLLLLMGVWVITIDGNNQHLHTVVNQQKATELLLTMRDSAHKRALVLHRMILINDPFELDEQNMLFSEKAAEFVAARDMLLSMNLNASYHEVWRSIQPHVAENSLAQDEVARMILDGRIDSANKRLHDEVIPKQDQVLGELTTLLASSREKVQVELSDIGSYNRTAYLLVGTLGITTLFLGIVTAVFVVRKTFNTEHMLVKAKSAEVNANQLKSQFLANMSHEIRTPLTAIIGFAEASLDSDMPETERAGATHTIISNGRHLLHVINEILDLSKIESNRLEVECFETAILPILVDIESVIGMQAREKGLSFEIEHEYPLPERIVTDPTRLKQILLNLCGNAVKFTEKGSVRVCVKYMPADQELCFSVIDTGIGMTPEQQHRMFTPFSQADASTTRRFGGTGLGLFISKQLTEKLGGSIKLQSLQDVGTRIDVAIATGPIDTVSLTSGTVAAAKGVCEVSSAPVPVGRVGGRVLLAEDSPDNQRLITMYISKAGAEVDCASNGQEAVEKALAGDFQLVLMDMQMPVMDGIEATQWLRKAGYTGPIVALTANAMKEDRERCSRAGCDAFLSKPIETGPFYEALARYLPGATEPQARNTAKPAVEYDPDLLELATTFIEDLPGRVQSMRESCDQADWQELASLAHKLKGIAGSFGFPDITEQAAVIEKQVKQEEYASLNGNLTALNALCEQATIQFKQLASMQEHA